MIGIVDNGTGAKKIASFFEEAKIISPNDQGVVESMDAYILSDGKPGKNQKEYNIQLIENSKKPILCTGVGFLYLAGFFDGMIKEVKPVNKKQVITIEHPCPLFEGIKKVHVKQNYTYILSNVPESFEAVGSHDGSTEIIQSFISPLIGTHFRVEKCKEGEELFEKFEKFSMTYDIYHPER